jgi:hypothetical protein
LAVVEWANTITVYGTSSGGIRRQFRGHRAPGGLQPITNLGEDDGIALPRRIGGDGPGLVVEALERPGRFGPVPGRRLEQFDGDEAVQDQMLGQVHLAHAAGPDEVEELVLVGEEDLARLRLRRSHGGV